MEEFIKRLEDNIPVIVCLQKRDGQDYGLQKNNVILYYYNRHEWRVLFFH